MLNSRKQESTRSNSVGSITDFIKRKREEGSPEGIVDSVKKSKTQAKQSEMERKGENKEMMLLLKEIKEEIEKNRKESAEFKNEIMNLHVELMSEMKGLLRDELQERDRKWQEEKRTMENKIKSLESGLEAQERNMRRNNVVIQGEIEKLMQEGTGLVERIGGLLLEEAKVNVQIDAAFKIGKKKDLILVKFRNFEDKQIVMKSRNLLLEKKVYINNDLTPKERTIQRHILQRAKEEKARGHSTRIGYMKLKIDETWWEWDDHSGALTPKK